MNLPANIIVQSTAELSTVICGSCSGIYAIAAKYKNQKRQQGGYWNCPYCSVQWGYGESENDRIKKQLQQEKKRKEWAEQDARVAWEHYDTADKSRNAYKGHLTRTKKRISNGVCPCCNRHFKNLHSHMKNQHPQYKEK